MHHNTSNFNQVLIVEDEPLFRTFIKNSLMGQSYKVFETGDANSALTIMETTPFDVVVTDINMPGKTGQDLLAEIKIKYPQTPVIVISGLPQVETAVECMKIGAFDFVTKPFEIEKLYQVIETAVEQSKKAAQDLGTLPLKTTVAQTLEGYSIIKTIGEGSMGIVFLVKKSNDEKDQTQYALKIVKTSLSENQNRKLLSRFFKEIEIVSKLDHPNIVKIYEQGFSDELRIPYFVMEYLDGKSLKEYTDRNDLLNFDEKIALLLQIASALANTHDEGICHRDIKPANIMILTNGQAKLMDFGIARIPGSELTQTKHPLGTPSYIAPELLKSSKGDFRSDIFSLGCVAYELLLGEKAFKGDSLYILAQQILDSLPVEPRKIQNNFPMTLQLILGKMLIKDCSLRYSNAGELGKDLVEFQNDSNPNSDFKKKLQCPWQTKVWS